MDIAFPNLGLLGLLVGLLGIAVTAFLGWLAWKKTKELLRDTEVISASTKALGADTEALIKDTEGLKKLIRDSAEETQKTFFDDVTSQIFENLKSNQKLATRMTTVHKEEKRALGDLLAKSEPRTSLLEAQIESITTTLDTNPTIFIESGSTLAYLAGALFHCNYIGLDRRLTIATNNVLVDFTLVFRRNVSVHLLEGTPAGRYGATFGDSNPIEEPPELVRQWNMREDRSETRPSSGFNRRSEAEHYLGAETQYRLMRQDLENFFSHHPPHVILMTCSGLSLQDGPHVGSFQNRDFKEALYHYGRTRKVPVYWILYDDKMHEAPMDPEDCVSVFGADALEHHESHGKLNDQDLGFRRFAHAIAEGYMSLVVTRGTGDEHGLADSLSKSGRLYQRLMQCRPKTESPVDPTADSEPTRNFQVLESPDNHVRIFQASKERLEHRWGSGAGIVRSVSAKLRESGYGLVDILARH